MAQFKIDKYIVGNGESQYVVVKPMKTITLPNGMIKMIADYKIGDKILTCGGTGPETIREIYGSTETEDGHFSYCVYVEENENGYWHKEIFGIVEQKIK